MYGPNFLIHSTVTSLVSSVYEMIKGTSHQSLGLTFNPVKDWFCHSRGSAFVTVTAGFG